ncbi:MAG: ExbD/TolR family protein [Bacteroidota bacterium]
MAEMQTPESRNRKGLHRNKKLSTRVDLTPMVDLGFLLITFFIFTTALSEPASIVMPLPDENETDNPTVTGERKTISLLLNDNNTILYYHGSNTNAIQQTDYSRKGLRAVLLAKIKQVKTEFGMKAEPVVLIRPLPASSYGNLVKVLDEMMINGVKKYMLLDEGYTQ